MPRIHTYVPTLASTWCRIPLLQWMLAGRRPARRRKRKGNFSLMLFYRRPQCQLMMRESADAASRKGSDQAQDRRATLLWTRAATARPRRPDTSRAPGRQSCVNIFPLYAMEAMIRNNTRAPARTPMCRSFLRPDTVVPRRRGGAWRAVAVTAFCGTHVTGRSKREVWAHDAHNGIWSTTLPSTDRVPSCCRTDRKRPRQRAGVTPSASVASGGGRMHEAEFVGCNSHSVRRNNTIV